MTNKLFLLFGFFAFCSSLFAQSGPPGTEEEILERYEKRIKQEKINGVYIPKDITDAFIQLNRLISEESKYKFKVLSEQQAIEKLHFSLGRWIIYNWGFYEGSRLSHFIRQLGITHPDDMANFIIIAYHRNLNKVPLNAKELVESFIEKQKKEVEEKRKNATVIHQETRKKSN